MILPGTEADVMHAIANAQLRGHRLYPLVLRAGIRIVAVRPLREIRLSGGITIRLRPVSGGTELTVRPRVLSPLLAPVRRGRPPS